MFIESKRVQVSASLTGLSKTDFIHIWMTYLTDCKHARDTAEAQNPQCDIFGEILEVCHRSLRQRHYDGDNFQNITGTYVAVIMMAT
jgi:hypothetical protein